MLDKLKDTAKNTFIYSLGNLSTKIIGLILLPLYTAKLSVLNYGKFAILETTSMFMILVFGLRIVSAMMRWFAEAENEEDLGKILFNSYAVLILVVLVINLIFQPLKYQLATLFFGTELNAAYFTVIFISISFEILNQVPMNLLRFRGKPLAYSLIFSGKLVVILFLNIYFLIYAQRGIIGIFYSQLIANCLVAIAFLPFLLSEFNYSFDSGLLKEMLGYSFPLIFSAISVQLLAIGDRFIIKYLLDYSQVGIYSLGYKIAGVLNVFVVQAFSLAFLPIAYKMLATEDAEIFFRKVFKYYAMILVLGALGLSLFAREILQLFAQKQEFWAAYNVVPFLCFAFVFKGLQYMSMLGFHYVKKTKYISWIVFSGLIINFGMNFLLIPSFGIYGAAAATLVSSIFISLLTYGISQKFYPIKYEKLKVLIVLLVGIVLFSISKLTFEWSFYVRIIVKAIIFALLPFLLYLFKFYEKTELQKMKKVLHRIIG